MSAPVRRIGLDARFLTHPQPGGFKSYTVNLVRALTQMDHGFEYVVYVDRPPETANELPRTDRVRYRVVRGTFPIVGMPLREQVGLPWRLREDRVDLVHFLCNTAPVLPGQPHVITLHDAIQVNGAVPFTWTAGFAAHRRWAITAYSRFSIRRSAPAARRLMTVSRFERDQISSCLGVTPERIAVTSPAPDPGFMCAVPEQKEQWRRDLATRFGLPGQFVLGVGHEPRKNIPLLIRAMACAAQACPLLSLVVVAAEERQRAAFQALAKELGVASRVMVLGRVTFGELVRLYNVAGAFLFPSEREGFGLPPLEAMVCGAPTIALRAAAIPEVVGDGGLLLSDNTPEAWGDAIARVMLDAPLREELVQRGLARAAMFTWRRCAEETEAVYREALEPRRA